MSLKTIFAVSVEFETCLEAIFYECVLVFTRKLLKGSYQDTHF